MRLLQEGKPLRQGRKYYKSVSLRRGVWTTLQNVLG